MTSKPVEVRVLITELHSVKIKTNGHRRQIRTDVISSVLNCKSFRDSADDEKNNFDLISRIDWFKKIVEILVFGIGENFHHLEFHLIFNIL